MCLLTDQSSIRQMKAMKTHLDTSHQPHLAMDMVNPPTRPLPHDHSPLINAHDSTEVGHAQKHPHDHPHQHPANSTSRNPTLSLK
jgi:hypothetical protein